MKKTFTVQSASSDIEEDDVLTSVDTGYAWTRNGVPEIFAAEADAKAAATLAGPRLVKTIYVREQPDFPAAL